MVHGHNLQAQLWMSCLGTSGFALCFFADDVVLFASPGHNLRRKMGQFPVEYEAAGMRIISSKSEDTVHWKKVECTLWLSDESQPQAKYLGKNEVRRFVIQRELEIEPLLLRVEKSQLRCLWHLI